MRLMPCGMPGSTGALFCIMAMAGGQLVVMPGGTDAPGVIEGRTQDTTGPPAAAVVMEDLLPGEHVAQQR